MFSYFWRRNKGDLDDGQDPRPSASKTIDFNLRNPHSSDILPSTSSNFESEDYSTSCSSSFESNDNLNFFSISYKINFDPEIFENHIFVATSDLESVNSADFEDEDSLHEFKLEESNLNVEFEPFILPHNE